MTQEQFNTEVLKLLISIVAEIDGRSEVGDDSCNRRFAEIRALAKKMGYTIDDE